MHRARRTPYRLPRRLFATTVAAALALLAAFACSKSNPVEPGTAQPAGGGGGGSASGTFAVQISASPPSLATGGSGTLTLKVQRNADLAPPADGSQVSLNTSLGYFSLNGAGKPVQSATATLSGGTARLSFFAGDELGTAEVLALFDDSTGNLSVPVTEPQAPAFFVEQVEPDVGSGQGGEKVTISGQGFTEPLRVTFGDAVAQVTQVSATAIVAKTPPPVPVLQAGETRRVDVAVTIDLDGEAPRTDTLPGGFIYTQGGGPFNQPAIFSVDPTQGPNEGGTTVVLRGQGFEDDARVFFGFDQGNRFDGVEATITSGPDLDGARVTVRSPAASGPGQALLNQTVDIKVENPRTGLSAVAPAAFRYGAGSGGGILVTDVSPASAPYTGLDVAGRRITVTLLGQGFGAANNANLRVTLAGVDQGTPTVASDSTLSFSLATARFSLCAPPSGPARVSNVVTGDSGASDLDFAYTAETPRLTGVSPASGAAAGGAAATVSGADLMGAGATSETVEITFDGVRATVTSATTDQVVATVPAFTGTFAEEDCDENGDGVAGKRSLPTAVDVDFVNRASGCSDTLPRAFTYQPADTSCRESDVTPPDLVANFTFVVSGLKVTFKNTSEGSPTGFFWDFGDGTTGIETTQADPIHTYGAAGDYSVTLFVEDGAGQQSSVTKTVTVN